MIAASWWLMQEAYQNDNEYNIFVMKVFILDEKSVNEIEDDWLG